MVRLRYAVKITGLIFAILLLCTGGSSQVLAGNGSAIYTYDALGRILTMTYDTGVIVIYTYDANGNRTQQIINVNSATLVWTATHNPCTSNCWGSALW